jgi:hypothetical protein
VLPEPTIDTGEKFIIQINLGGDTEIFEKVITPVKPLLPTNKIVTDGLRTIELP